MEDLADRVAGDHIESSSLGTDRPARVYQGRLCYSDPHWRVPVSVSATRFELSFLALMNAVLCDHMACENPSRKSQRPLSRQLPFTVVDTQSSVP